MFLNVRFNILALNRKEDAMSNFIDGTYKITEGEVFEDFDSNNCIISSELAEANELSVGDTITFNDPNNEENTIELVITGIYEENDKDMGNAMNIFSNSANQIITGTKVINDFASTSDDLKTTITPTFILKSADDIDSFSKELTDKGLDENLTLSTNLEEVEQSTSTISKVKSFAETFLILTLVIGAVVLFVVNMINIRERKYEIGVLRTIGMNKVLLCVQFMCELLIITVFGLIIGSGIGALASVKVSNSLLASEIESSKNKTEDISKNFGRGPEGMGGGNMPAFQPDMGNSKKFKGVVSVQAYDSIDAVVDYKVLIELLGIGIVLTLVSSSASVVAIDRFQPLEILKERS